MSPQSREIPSLCDVAASEAAERTLEFPSRASRGPWRVELGALTPTSTVLRLGEQVTLGSGRQAAIRVDDPAVSGLHCRLTVTELGVGIEDLGSRNGLYVGGARVTSALLTEAFATFVVGRTAVSLRSVNDDEASEPDADPLPGVVGSSAPMLRVARSVRRHAQKRVPILLQGESGTGKDVVARAIHELGRRAGPYVPLNVATLPDSLADAELFGHRRGAFTGAVVSRPGAFEQAHGGTLFLDEIAELSPQVQVKLLRIVEDGSVRALGATRASQVDVRVVSATWAPLDERVADGRFRADLFHRLATVVIDLPPLRQRKSDIAVLASFLLLRLRDDVGEKRLSSAALSLLLTHGWPGNVRELASVIYRAAVDSTGMEIQARHVEDACQRAVPRSSTPGNDLQHLLECHAGNISAAARAARVPRSTFRGWLAKTGAPRRSERTDQGEAAVGGAENRDDRCVEPLSSGAPRLRVGFPVS
jgi:transcriptional regulator of acetoin/glycerol metabolism